MQFREGRFGIRGSGWDNNEDEMEMEMEMLPIHTSSLLDARTALLCRHRSGVEINCTQRIGMLNSFARDVQ